MTNIDMSRYTLRFADEFDEASFFDGESGTWKTEGYWGWRTLEGNAEQQIFVDPGYRGLGLDPFAIEDGALVISAQPASEEIKPLIDGFEYTSGMISSDHSFSMQYGYFEMRAQMPAGQGIWPAFWLLTADGEWPPEYDVVEVLGHEPDKLYGTAHFIDENGQKREDHAVVDTFFDSSDGFHTYGFEWNESEIIWYYDGIEAGRSQNLVFDQPMYMLTTLAVGGYWPGNADETTPWPAEMKIDYIRAYTLNATHEILGVPADWAPIDMARFSGLDGSDAPSTWDWSTWMADGETAISLEGDWARYVVGNDGDNFIRGSNAQYNQIEGGRGDDVLEGRGGTNLYVFRPGDGYDTILDFTNVVGATDKIRLEGFHFRHFDDVIAWSEQVGDDVVIRLAEDQAILLADVQMADLAPEQFVFTDPVAPPEGALPIASAQPVDPIAADPVVVEPVEPEPVFAEPEPVLVEPEPVLSEPEPVLPEPAPVLAEPVPVLAEPEPVLPEPAPEPVPEEIVVERGNSGRGRGALEKLEAENAELKALLASFEEVDAAAPSAGPPDWAAAWSNGKALGLLDKQGGAMARAEAVVADAFAASSAAAGDLAWAASFAKSGGASAFSFAFVEMPSADEIASLTSDTFADLMAG